jgi:hypothetical protein
MPFIACTRDIPGDVILCQEHTHLGRPNYKGRAAWIPYIVIGAPELFLGGQPDSYYLLRQSDRLINELTNTVLWFGIILDYTDDKWGSHGIQEVLQHFGFLLYHIRRLNFVPTEELTDYVTKMFIAFIDCKPDRHVPLAWMRSMEALTPSMPAICSAIAKKQDNAASCRSVMEKMIQQDLFHLKVPGKFQNCKLKTTMRHEARESERMKTRQSRRDDRMSLTANE